LLITGASSGIGREMAVQMSAAWPLILHGRDAARLEQTRQACAEPARHLVWQHDLADVDGLAASLAGVIGGAGVRVCAFVHCAALLQVLPLRSLATAQVREAFNVNALSAMEIVNVLMKKKINERHLKSVVFISTIASQFGARGFSAYCASKAALDGLMKALAVELAPQVRVNSVLPGGIRTPMTREIFAAPEMVEKFERDYPLGIGEPADVIHLVEFLVSEKARWITGQQMVVDGGRTANITA
jgi:NAD(P)-dependent dehydrogenase (short-subunit alcohol dehydrogenase family)